MGRDVAAPKAPGAGQILGVIGRLPKYVRLTLALWRDRRTPRGAKLMLGGAGLYMLSPINLIPGLVPLIGEIDDLYIGLKALRSALRRLGPEAAGEHLERLGLSQSQLDEDLRIVTQTAAALAAAGGRLGVRAGVAGLSMAIRGTRWGLRKGIAWGAGRLRRRWTQPQYS